MKRSIAVMLIMVMVLISACSSGNSGTNESNNGDNRSNTQNTANNPPAANENNEDEASDEPAELVIFTQSGDSEESFNARFGDLIREKFPNYTITYKPASKEYGLKEMIAAGEQIDIYFDSIGFIQGYFESDVQMDMTELIESHGLDLSKLEPTVVDSIKMLSDGGIYAVPVFNNNVVLYYNKDLFDRFGVDYPKDGMTWEELSELSKKMTRNEGGEQYFGYATSTTHVLRMNQMSLPYVDENEQATINQDERWKSFYEKVFVDPMSHYIDFSKANDGFGPYRNEFLQTKNLAMFVWLSSIIFVFQEDFTNMNWDMVALPTFSDNPGVGSQPYPTYFGIANSSKNKEAAMKVIEYLISEEAQSHLSKIGVMPVLNDDHIKSQLGTESAFKGKNFGAMFYNQFAPVPKKGKYESLGDSPYHYAIWPIRDTDDYNTAFRDAAESLNQAIKDAKGQ
ncbi:ABC transporter substrate-binding protein [Marinicrinis lubricantis]|uniref:ABC transporter substrate-binding protein n=1 Tax=Marinicrinis lubricantis TaxID=2086470 RepID=A0ABW1IQL8_9BACL